MGAGLPNITGTVGIHPTAAFAGMTGAFYETNKNGAGNNSQSGTANHLTGFNASRSSSVYGNSGTVTPTSQSTLLCIKY